MSKMKLGNITDVLSRAEMKNIIAGYMPPKSCTSCKGTNGISYSCDYSSFGGIDTCTCSSGQNDGTGCKVVNS